MPTDIITDENTRARENLNHELDNLALEYKALHQSVLSFLGACYQKGKVETEDIVTDERQYQPNIELRVTCHLDKYHLRAIYPKLKEQPFKETSPKSVRVYTDEEWERLKMSEDMDVPLRDRVLSPTPTLYYEVAGNISALRNTDVGDRGCTLTTFRGGSYQADISIDHQRAEIDTRDVGTDKPLIQIFGNFPDIQRESLCDKGVRVIKETRNLLERISSN